MTFIDSSDIGELVLFRRRCLSAASNVGLRNAPAGTCRVLQIIVLLDFFSTEEAPDLSSVG